MYMYVYIYVYICMYMYLYICIYICIYTHTRVFQSVPECPIVSQGRESFCNGTHVVGASHTATLCCALQNPSVMGNPPPTLRILQ